MLISPYNLAPITTRTIRPLTRQQLQWFLSSEAFLENLGRLRDVGVVPYCGICAYARQRDDVSATWKPEATAWVVRSACRTGEIARAKVRALPLAELLATLGWRLRCGYRCQELGMADGVMGDNFEGSARLSIVCGCTERVLDASGN